MTKIHLNIGVKGLCVEYCRTDCRNLATLYLIRRRMTCMTHYSPTLGLIASSFCAFTSQCDSGITHLGQLMSETNTKKSCATHTNHHHHGKRGSLPSSKVIVLIAAFKNSIIIGGHNFRYSVFAISLEKKMLY